MKELSILKINLKSLLVVDLAHIRFGATTFFERHLKLKDKRIEDKG